MTHTHTLPALKLKAACYSDSLESSLYYYSLLFFLSFLLSPTFRKMSPELTLFALKLQFSRIIPKFAGICHLSCVWQPASLYLQKLCANCSPLQSEKEKRQWGGKGAKVAILGELCGWLPNLINLSQISVTQQNKRVKINEITQWCRIQHGITVLLHLWTCWSFCFMHRKTCKWTLNKPVEESKMETCSFTDN